MKASQMLLCLSILGVVDGGPIQSEYGASLCTYDNNTYGAGETFKPDPCTFCHCPWKGGSARCAIQDCQFTPHCLKVHHPQEECCGVCLEYGCLHTDGKVYALGSSVPVKSACEECFCPARGGPIICRRRQCSQVDCVDPVMDIDGCCQICQNGANCWLGTDIIRAGEKIRRSTCQLCQCISAITAFWERRSQRHLNAKCTHDHECTENI